MYSSAQPGARDLVGSSVQVDAKSHIKVTTLSRDLNADGSVRRYRIHGNLHGTSKQWYTVGSGKWSHRFLASRIDVERTLRDAAALPSDAVTELESELLLP